MTRAKHDGGLVFQELESFNKALLGKMASRLMQEPNALWARVLKGIYFLVSAWSSLLVGREVLRQAGVWSLGDGTTIRAFMDPWIPGHSNTRLGQHPVTATQASTTVAEWIVDSVWDEGAVRAAISDDEAEVVLKIPIPIQHRRDEMRWPFEKGGTAYSQISVPFP